MYSRLAREEAITLGLLSQLRGMTLRTKFAKLVYLLDNTYFEHLGKQATELSYCWDHYGPNAVGNAITQILVKLEASGLVRHSERLTPYEDTANYYAVSDTVDASKLPLSSTDWMFIRLIAKRFGSKSREEVVRAAKATAPMQGVKQYQMLTFRPNQQIETLRASFFADRSFVEQTQQALNSSGRFITLEELRASVV